MKIKDLKINFRYLGGNIACLSVDSIVGESIHNDIDNEEAIIIFNSLVGEKENYQTVKTLLKENQELEKQLEKINKFKFSCKKDETQIPTTIYNKKNVEDISKIKFQQKEFINYLEDVIKELQKIKETELDYDILKDVIPQLLAYKEILQKYKEIIGVSDENKTTI